MELHQSLTRSKTHSHRLPRHEQGGVFAAEGYARATGKAGVAIATSGPGATNLVTGVADAYLDSIPLVVITGQVPRAMIGKGAFQETDVFGLSLPIVKHSYLVMNVEDIPHVFKEAFYIATTGGRARSGSTFRRDVQQALQAGVPGQSEFPRLQSRQTHQRHRRQRDRGVDRKERTAGDLLRWRHHFANARPELIEFAEKANIPVATTLMGIGAIPAEHDCRCAGSGCTARLRQFGGRQI